MPLEKTYHGTRNKAGCHVWVEEKGMPRRPLPLRLDLWNHSPSGFEWNYAGSGPAQLALALLADHLGDDRRAVRLHQPFKWKVVVSLAHEGWSLTAAAVDTAIADVLAERPDLAPLGEDTSTDDDGDGS